MLITAIIARLLIFMYLLNFASWTNANEKANPIPASNNKIIYNFDEAKAKMAASISARARAPSNPRKGFGFPTFIGGGRLFGVT